MSLDSIEDKINLLYLIDSNKEVRLLKYLDVEIWPVLRMQIGNKLWKDNNIEVKKQRKTNVFSVIQSYGNYFKYFFKDRYNNQKISKADVLVISSSVYRNTMIDGKFIHRIADPIILHHQNKGDNVVHFEFSGSREIYKTPRFLSSVFIQPLCKTSQIAARLLYVFFLFTPDFKLVKNKISEIYAKNNVSAILPNKLLMDIIYLRVLSIVYTPFVRYINPKRAYVIPYYCYEGYAFVRSCKRLGIPVYDVQHGVQGKYHYAYSKWHQSPGDSYSVFPDGFVVNNKKDKELLESLLPFCKIELFENGLKNILRNSKSYENEKIKLKELLPSGRNKLVLITLQKGRGFPEIYKQLINNSAELSVYWLIRFHPAMTDEKNEITNVLRQIPNDKIDIKVANELTLLSLLDSVDMHITEFSTVAFEAAAEGIKSIVVHKTGLKYYEAEITSGLIIYSEDIKVITSEISDFTSIEK